MFGKILTIVLPIAVSAVAIAAPRLALDSPSVDFGEVAANAALVREVRVGHIHRGDPLMPPFNCWSYTWGISL